MIRHLTHLISCLLAVALIQCGPQDTELNRSHAYMDSLKTMLGELRLMDHELNQIVADHEGPVSANLIIPIISDKLRPTVATLHSRTTTLQTTPATESVHQLMMKYLDARLKAYNTALQGQAESRPELFEAFALEQIGAETLGRELADEIYRLRGQIPGYH